MHLRKSLFFVIAIYMIHPHACHLNTEVPGCPESQVNCQPGLQATTDVFSSTTIDSQQFLRDRNINEAHAIMDKQQVLHGKDMNETHAAIHKQQVFHGKDLTENHSNAQKQQQLPGKVMNETNVAVDAQQLHHSRDMNETNDYSGAGKAEAEQKIDRSYAYIDDYVDEDKQSPIENIQDIQKQLSVTSATVVEPRTEMSAAMREERLRQIARERDRQLRVQNFQLGVLRGLGFQTPPAINLHSRHKLLEQLRERPDLQIPQVDTTEQRRCSLSDCSVPESVDGELWDSTEQPGFRLHFPVPKLSRRGPGDGHIKEARLKLFLKPKTDFLCSLHGNVDDLEDSLDIIVTVRQFIRPLVMKKRKRMVYKLRVLDAKVVVSEGNLWLALNIKQAVTTWMTRSRKNFGLEVTAKDTNGTVLNAHDLFVMPECRQSRGTEISYRNTERTCRDDNGRVIEELPWTLSRIRPSSVMKNTPYIDVTTTERYFEEYH